MQGEVGERRIGHVGHVAHVLQLGQGLVVFPVFPGDVVGVAEQPAGDLLRQTLLKHGVGGVGHFFVPFLW